MNNLIRGITLLAAAVPAFSQSLFNIISDPPFASACLSYDYTFTTGGGVQPIAWAQPTGTIPPGLTFNTSGPNGFRISGTPTQPGFYNFVLRADDSTGQVAFESVEFPVGISSVVEITSSSPLPSGLQGQPYSFQFAGCTGSPPGTWSLNPGSTLPPGLTLNSAGLLTGTPTQAGLFTFTIRLTASTIITFAGTERRAIEPQQSGPPFTTKVFTLNIVAPVPPLMITTASPLPPQTAGQPVNIQFAATGGSPPFFWSASGLPSGLSMSSSGQLTGSTNSTGTFQFLVRVDGYPESSAEKNFQLTVNPPIPPLTITTPSPLPSGTVGAPYSQSIQASGGTPPYTFLQTSGSLPPGLSFASSGALTGTPAQAGPFIFRIRVSDSQNVQAFKDFSLNINAALTIVTSSLAIATPGVPYTQPLEASGGTPGYTWSLAQGTLPSGLSVNPSGSISGTTSQSGGFPITIGVTDAAGVQATRAFTLTVRQPLSIVTPPLLPEMTAGTAVILTLQATGGVPGYTWSVVQGTLPAGLTLNPTSGVISGIPSTGGSVNFTARVTDSSGVQVSRTFTGTIGERPPDPIVITTASPLPDIAVGQFTSYGFSAQGGNPPYSWSLVSGTPPDGLSLAGNQLRGTPTRDGTFTFTIEASDADDRTASKTFTLTVTRPLTITTGSPLPDLFVGVASSLRIEAAGGRPPYAFSTTGGSLPAGLTLAASGEITGTPTQTGRYSFTAQVQDQTGRTSSKSFTGEVVPGPTITTESPLTGFAAGTASNVSLSATGGRAPYTWAITAGSLPPGITLNGSSGALTGTPTQTGRFAFTAQVTDANRQVATKAFTGEVVAGLTITTTSPLPDLTVGVAGSIGLAATGGFQPYRWSLTGGALPPGMTLDGSGSISGTPTREGDYTINVQVVDARNSTASRTLSGRVLPQLLITTDCALPDARVGTALSVQFAATGALGPINWSSAGNLPPGLSVSPTGLLSGTPTTGGNYTFNVNAASGPQSAQRPCRLTVIVPPVPSVTISGVPDTAQPGQQPRITLTIGQPFPAEIQGTITLTFQPDAINNADDPSVQFSSGGRTLRFTIPAGSTAAAFVPAEPLLQTGTVAGTITLTTALTSNGQVVTCDCPLTRTIRIPRTPPIISRVQVTRSGNTLTMTITGSSPTRDLTSAQIRFAGTSALQTTDLTVQLGTLFTQYYQGTASQPFGSQFLLTIPFTINGDASAVSSVTVTLTNSAGTSQPSSATF